MAENCKVITNKCGRMRQVCWTRAGKIKSNRAVTATHFGVPTIADRPTKRFVAKSECLVSYTDAKGRSRKKLKKGFRFVNGRCKHVGTPGLRGRRAR